MGNGREAASPQGSSWAGGGQAWVHLLLHPRRAPQPRGRVGRGPGAVTAAAQSPAQSFSTGDTGGMWPLTARTGPAFLGAAGSDESRHPSPLKSLPFQGQTPNSPPHTGSCAAHCSPLPHTPYPALLPHTTLAVTPMLGLLQKHTHQTNSPK